MSKRLKRQTEKKLTGQRLKNFEQQNDNNFNGSETHKIWLNQWDYKDTTKNNQSSLEDNKKPSYFKI